MNTSIDSVFKDNKQAVAMGAYLEAGRIANSQMVKLAAKHLPIMVRGYADTPVGKLVVANLTRMILAEMRPADAKLQKLTASMMAAAYQDVIGTIDIDGFITKLLDSGEIKSALAKMSKADDEAFVVGA